MRLVSVVTHKIGWEIYLVGRPPPRGSLSFCRVQLMEFFWDFLFFCSCWLSCEDLKSNQYGHHQLDWQYGCGTFFPVVTCGIAAKNITMGSIGTFRIDRNAKIKDFKMADRITVTFLLQSFQFWSFSCLKKYEGQKISRKSLFPA